MLNDIIDMLTNGFSSKKKKSNFSENDAILNEIKDLSKSKLNKCLKDAEHIAIKAGKYSLKYFPVRNPIPE